MNRRNFLDICNKFGLSYASFPLLGALPSLAHAADLEITRNKRFLAIYHPHGMHQPSWTCGSGDRQGNNWQLSKVLEPLQPVKNKINILEGISGYSKSSAERHQLGMVGWLTGGELFREGYSIDQIVADHWKTKPLLLGVQAAPRLYNFKSNYENFRISFRGNGDAGAQKTNNNPWSAFNQTFSGLTDNSVGRFASNRSVLDAVLEEVNSVKRRLNTDDLHLLDLHQQNIRELECKLHGIYCDNDMATPAPITACQIPTMANQPNNLDSYLTRQENFPAIANLQADITVAAIACNIAPVTVLQYAATESTHTYSWVTNDQGKPATSSDHHELSHNIYTSATASRDFAAIHRWYSTQVANIASKLDNIADINGSVLDNTVMYWGTCLGSPHDHHHRNWPSVLIGSAGGYFKTNQSLDFRKRANGQCHYDPRNCFRDFISDTSQTDLLNTIADSLGLPVTDSNPVVGNMTNRTNDGTHVNNSYHGVIRKLQA